MDVVPWFSVDSNAFVPPVFSIVSFMIYNPDQFPRGPSRACVSPGTSGKYLGLHVRGSTITGVSNPKYAQI